MSAPVAFHEADGYVTAELKGSIHGIYGVGRTRALALDDLRAAIREFADILGTDDLSWSSSSAWQFPVELR